MTDIQQRLTVALADRYSIEREIGAGGMATVFLAHDVKHEREVAIKVLHPDLGAALGGERFLTEIKTTAKLQHPHVLPLLDSGDAGQGLLFYVMPLVTGETLRARLNRERQLPLDEALVIAREVADALGYAHGKGVIHRDIKPENILLQDGHALVADFGIALAVQTAGGARMTQTGLSLGTPQYMSPEQAMGERAIDARADVYALGAVLYEMLCGEPPFAGATVQSIVAKVLTERPVAPSALRDTIPASVEGAVLRALAKLPADRFANASAFAEALRSHGGDTLSSGGRAAPAAGTIAAMRGATQRRSWLPVVAGVVVATLGIGGGAWLSMGDGAGAPAPALALVLETEGNGLDLRRFAVSLDGEAVAISADEGIQLREAGTRAWRLLPGTEGAESPSFSPDGQWIAFSTNGALRRVSLRGGAPIAVLGADTIDANRVRYGRQGQIAFEGRDGLWVAPADGGAPRRLAKAGRGISPRLTPDGRGVLYVNESQGSRLMYYDLEKDDTTQVLEQASEGELTDDGYLLYGNSQGGLFAVKFDQRQRRTVGNPVPLVADMPVQSAVGPFAVSPNGLLVHLSGSEPSVRVLVGMIGARFDTLPLPPQQVSYLRFSPDGSRLAITMGSARGSLRSTGLYDFASKTLTQFGVGGGPHAPVWSPDGREMVFTATDSTADAEDLFLQPVDGSRPPRRIARRPGDQHGMAWVDDSTVVFSDGSPANATRGRAAISIVDPRGSSESRDFLRGEYNGFHSAISPDGRWIVYGSDESGRAEIYLRPFPALRTGAQWKLSAGGGLQPRWSGDGRSVYFFSYSGSSYDLQRVDVSVGETVVVSPPRRMNIPRGITTAWDLDRRTGRISLAQSEANDEAKLVAVPNWRRLLRSTDMPK